MGGGESRGGECVDLLFNEAAPTDIYTLSLYDTLTNFACGTGAASMLDAGMGFCYQRAVRAKLIADAKLVVVKLGTGILTDRRNRLASSRIKQIVAQVARARKTGWEVVLVSSEIGRASRRGRVAISVGAGTLTKHNLNDTLSLILHSPLHL